MERLISLDTEDGFRIYGVLNGQGQTDQLVVFVHGLTGERDYHLYHRAARLFPEEGVDTFRFDLFSNQPKGRVLTDCSLTTFSQDLSLILAFFSKSYKSIHVIGHSIGGCVAINADHQYVNSLILWDTALQKAPEGKLPFEYHQALNLYIARLKIEYLLSPELIRERSEQDGRILGDLGCPVKLVFAGNTAAQHSWSGLIEHLSVHYEKVVIEGAGHGFSEWGVDEKLFETTLQWLAKEH